MLNQVVIAGRLTDEVLIETTEDGKKRASITVAVPRSYKNVDGTYDTDFIKCYLWNGIAESTKEYCQKGDIVGIKGRIQTEENTNIVIAEKVTFLSTHRNNEGEN